MSITAWIISATVLLVALIIVAAFVFHIIKPLQHLSKKGMILLLLFFNFTDWLTTIVLIHFFNGEELNPFLAAVIVDGVPSLSFHFIKLVIGSAILAMLANRFETPLIIGRAVIIRDMRFIPIGAAMLYAFASVNNAAAIMFFF